MNRRQLLAVSTAAILTPGALAKLLTTPHDAVSEIVDLDRALADLSNYPSQWSPHDLARFVAVWELAAQQRDRPDRWRRLHYTGALQWCDGRDGRLPLIAWYGIGTRQQTTHDLHRLTAWLDDAAEASDDERAESPILATVQVAGGRAFAIVSAGLLSKRLRHELARPAWRRGGLDDEKRMNPQRREIALALRAENPKRYTQEVVAGMLGVTQSTVAKWYSSGSIIPTNNASPPDARRKLSEEQVAEVVKRDAAGWSSG